MGNTMTITRQEFETEYAENSGITVGYLRTMGLFTIPCNCGEEGCRGWQMCHWATLDSREIQFIPEPYRTEATELRSAQLRRMTGESV